MTPQARQTAMHCRAAQHEIAAGRADLNAILHQTNMLRRDVLTALVQAMGDRFQANLMTFGAVIDALPHGG
jgi:hypothetical protein